MRLVLLTPQRMHGRSGRSGRSSSSEQEFPCSARGWCNRPRTGANACVRAQLVCVRTGTYRCSLQHVVGRGLHVGRTHDVCELAARGRGSCGTSHSTRGLIIIRLLSRPCENKQTNNKQTRVRAWVSGWVGTEAMNGARTHARTHARTRCVHGVVGNL